MSVITQDGYSALILAARLRYTKVVMELLKAKANMDLPDEVCSRLTVASHCIYMYMYMYILLHTCYSVEQ